MPSRKIRGFTLVEVLVSAAILACAVLVVVAVVRKGSELYVNDLHRRKAGAAISSLFESPRFGYINYTTLAPQTVIDTVTIDERTQSGTVLRGVRTVTIGAEETQATVPVKRIRISVRWNEGDEQDSIVMEKWITQAL